LYNGLNRATLQTQNFTYDALNRLSSGEAVGGGDPHIDDEGSRVDANEHKMIVYPDGREREHHGKFHFEYLAPKEILCEKSVRYFRLFIC